MTLTKEKLRADSFSLTYGAAVSIEQLIKSLGTGRKFFSTYKCLMLIQDPLFAEARPFKFRFIVMPYNIPFTWYITPQEASIPHLIDGIRTQYQQPGFILINATMMILVVGDKRHVVETDQELEDKLQAFANVNSYDITVNLESRMYISLQFLVSKLTSYVAQQAFTDYTFPMACSLFGLPGDPTELPPFPFGRYSLARDKTGTFFDTAASNAFKHLIADLQIRYDPLSFDMSALIPSFLIAVSSLFEDITVRPQYPVYGQYGQGPVDFVLKTGTPGEILSCVTVVRHGFSYDGIAQNIVQLESSLSRRASGDTRIGDGEVKVFGLVTDAKEWWALECTKTENLSVRISKITVINYDSEGWQEMVEEVFGTLVWLFQRMVDVAK